MTATAELRVGSVDDLDAVMALFDAAIAWLVEQGRTGQWGNQPWSASAERDGAAVAGLAHGPVAHDYVAPATDREDYVLLLVADPSVRGGGRRLLDESWARARADGVERQRVDCYAGDDGKLVRFYESAGFTRTDTFDVDGWPGQVLERRA